MRIIHLFTNIKGLTPQEKHDLIKSIDLPFITHDRNLQDYDDIVYFNALKKVEIISTLGGSLTDGFDSFIDKDYEAKERSLFREVSNNDFITLIKEYLEDEKKAKKKNASNY